MSAQQPAGLRNEGPAKVGRDEEQLLVGTVRRRRKRGGTRVIRVKKPKSIKRYRCCNCTAVTFRLVVGILAVIALIPTLVLVILTYLNSKNAAESNWNSVLTGEETIAVGDVGGVPGQRAQAAIRMHGNNLHISWDVLKQTGNISAVTGFQICGPLSSSEPTVSSTCTALCGAPSTLACEGTDPGRFSASIDALQPGSISPEPFIVAVRRDPTLYYPRLEHVGGVLRGSLYASGRGT